jgi:signal transduction histidine kinase
LNNRSESERPKGLSLSSDAFDPAHAEESSSSLEAPLRLAAQMQSLARLHNGLAHDLKSPLNAMVLNLELLKRSLQGSLGDPSEVRDRQKRWVALLERELLRLRDSLDLVLAQLAIPDEEPETFDLDKLVEELEALLGPQARQRHIELRRSPPPSVMATVAGRRGPVKQSLLAVAAALLDALDEGGRLSLELAVSAQGVAVTLDGSPRHDATPRGPQGSEGAAVPGELPLQWARAVAVESGGTSHWTTNARGSVHFELTLPLATAGSRNDAESPGHR